jgi:hypothetical protein
MAAVRPLPYLKRGNVCRRARHPRRRQGSTAFARKGDADLDVLTRARP